MYDTIEKMPSWWPKFSLPPYKEGVYGNWEICVRNPPLIRSYYSGLVKPELDNFVLSKNGQLWMSTTPMEIESQGVFVHAARGNVVIGGLGLGLTLFNMAIKSSVDHIYVYEIDKEVIELFKECCEFDEWFCKDKITIINRDILRTTALPPAGNGRIDIDLLYMDIWEDMGAVRAQQNTFDVYRALSPKCVGWWTMEMDFIQWCTANDITAHTVTEGDLMQWQEELCMRIVPTDYAKEWVQMANVAAANMVNM